MRAGWRSRRRGPGGIRRMSEPAPGIEKRGVNPAGARVKGHGWVGDPAGALSRDNQALPSYDGRHESHRFPVTSGSPSPQPILSRKQEKGLLKGVPVWPAPKGLFTARWRSSCRFTVWIRSRTDPRDPPDGPVKRKGTAVLLRAPFTADSDASVPVRKWCPKV